MEWIYWMRVKEREWERKGESQLSDNWVRRSRIAIVKVKEASVKGGTDLVKPFEVRTHWCLFECHMHDRTQHMNWPRVVTCKWQWIVEWKSSKKSKKRRRRRGKKEEEKKRTERRLPRELERETKWEAKRIKKKKKRNHVRVVGTVTHCKWLGGNASFTRSKIENRIYWTHIEHTHTHRKRKSNQVVLARKKSESEEVMAIDATLTKVIDNTNW